VGITYTPQANKDSEHGQILAHINRYISLSAEEEAQFTAHLKPQTFKKGSFLLEAGQRCNRQYFIVKGCVRTFYTDQKAEEHIIQFGIENWWAADLGSFIKHTAADYHIQALVNTEVLVLEQEVLEELYMRIPKLERLFRIIIQNAYVAAQQRIVATISQTAEERYAAFLHKYPGLDQRVPQYMIASYIGVTPEFFSKMKKEFYR
jgi:CRP-like cAMP-binding protein